MQIGSSWTGEAFTKAGGPLTATGARVFEGVLSDGEPDCQGDEIKGWLLLADELPLLWLHDVAKRIGTIRPRLEGKRLVGRGELFARGHSDETANAIYQLSQPAGLAASIGGLKWHRPDGLHAIVSEVSLTPPGGACCRNARVSLAKMEKSLHGTAGSAWDPLEDVRAYAAEKRAEMADAIKNPPRAPTLAELIAQGHDEYDAADRLKAIRRFDALKRVIG